MIESMNTLNLACGSYEGLGMTLLVLAGGAILFIGAIVRCVVGVITNAVRHFT